MDISDNDFFNDDELLNFNLDLDLDFDLNLIFNNLKLFNSNTLKLDLDNNYSFYAGLHPSRYRDNFNHCYACNKYMLISRTELPEFFVNNLEKRINKKNIIIMYRLFDECNFYIKFNFLTKFQKIIKNITPANTFINSSEWKLIYETYFNQQGLNNLDYIKCNNCNYNFCPMHCDIARFKHFKCLLCRKNFDVCNWCKSNYAENICFTCF